MTDCKEGAVAWHAQLVRSIGMLRQGMPAGLLEGAGSSARGLPKLADAGRG